LCAGRFDARTGIGGGVWGSAKEVVPSSEMAGRGEPEEGSRRCRLLVGVERIVKMKDILRKERRERLISLLWCEEPHVNVRRLRTTLGSTGDLCMRECGPVRVQRAG
jgi:hypothetical protein